MHKRNTKIIILLLIIVFSCFIYLITIKSNEGMDKITLHNWWSLDDHESIAIFEQLFQDIDKKVDVYSIFGEPNFERKEDTLYVQFSGERIYHDPLLFDINIIPTEKVSDNIITLPYSFYHCLWSHKDVNQLLSKRILHTEKEKFCLFAVSNPGFNERDHFFHELSKYKQVDSCGKHLNNIEKCPGDHASKEYQDIISQYKFMMCFENGSMHNYFTEKLINSYYNHTIPIYWGCPNISDYVNMDAILYLKPDFTEQDVQRLIQEIEYLDKNDQAYRKKYESVFFKNGELPKEFNIHSIQAEITRKLTPVGTL